MRFVEAFNKEEKEVIAKKKALKTRFIPSRRLGGGASHAPGSPRGGAPRAPGAFGCGF